jgi:hypothetical protein
MAKNIHTRLSTGTPTIAALVGDLKKGEIKVPQFQRPFVWKDEQAVELLDSIANNYPVGSLLLWRTPSKLATERNIGDFQLPMTDDLTPTDYVLDGQQRLTVIYSCLGAAESDPGFAAAYDLEKEAFLKKPNAHSIHTFPMRWLYDTTKLLNFRTALLSHPQNEVLNKRFDDMYQAVTTYQVPVVTLKDLTVEEVCPIFERINSSGTRLSTYDLMVAATWSPTFDLNEEASKIKNALRRKGFEDIGGDTILKALAAVQKQSIKKGDVIALRKLAKNDMEALVVNTKEALLKTVDLLTTEFKIHSWAFLPYEAIALVLCYVFAHTKGLTPEQVRRVRQWFWRSSFGERYRGASEHFISQDLKLIHDFVIDNKGKTEQFGAVPTDELWSSVVFRGYNSRSRAFILMLALNGPRNLTNASAIDPAQALSIYNQKEFHHIYPRAYLKANNIRGEHNAVANFCMLAASENKVISDEDPNSYLPECISTLGDNVAGVFKSAMLPSPADFPYATATYADFIASRCPLLTERARQLCEGS